MQDLTPRVPAAFGSAPSAGDNTGAIFRQGGHLWYDDGTTVWQLDNQGALAPSIRAVTSDTTLVLADAGVVTNTASANDVTVPPDSSVAFPLYTLISVVQRGTGKTSIVAGSGVTIEAGSLGLRAQFSGCTLLKTASDTWVLTGDTDDGGGGMPNVFFKGTSSGSPFQTVGGSAFSQVNIGTSVFAVGGIGLNGSNKIDIPVTGIYSCKFLARISDNQSVRSFGMALGTTAGDSADFLWRSNTAYLYTNRDSFQWSNDMLFTAGDEVFPFIYSDGANAPLESIAVTMKLIST